MKPLLFIVTLLVCFRCYGQTDYYFANNGDDNNTGRITAPFKTINKLNTLSLKPGDNVHFKCGDTFKGQINILTSGNQSNPITFGSYGQGNKPIINCSEEMKNWVKLPSRNIWEAPIPKNASLNELYINSKIAQLARYPKSTAPNKGYLSIASHSGKSQLTSKEKINGNWVGAELVYMPYQYIIEKCKVIAQSGNTFTIITPNNYDISDGWGFFLQNHIEALASDGDWCVDTVKNSVLLYYEKGDLNKQKIEATSINNGINMVNCSSIILTNLQIDKTVCGVAGTNVSNITINAINIDHSEEDGIKLTGKCSDISIENSNINHTNNDGVYIYKANNFKFINNNIRNTGLKVGRGKSGTGQYIALDYAGDAGNSIIQGNKIDSVGYIGIEFVASNILVKNNVISNFCFVKSDGGGIYTFNGWQRNTANQIITSNIIMGTHIDSIPIRNRLPHVDGIYMDDCSQNVIISDNTIANCETNGIFLHGTKNVTVTGNTCFNNNTQLALVFGKCDNIGNKTTNNIFFSRTKAQPVAIYGEQRNPTDDYGEFNNNLYICPDTTQLLLSGYNEETRQSKRISLGGWKSKLSKDVASHSLGGPDIYSRDIKFEFNDSPNPKTVKLNGQYRDIKNKNLTNQVIIQPYSSVILYKN